ncbi:MAG: hypothetical protein ACOX68_00520 [Candidatus Limivicinus sp.]|jgi:hypothetical protein
MNYPECYDFDIQLFAGDGREIHSRAGDKKAPDAGEQTGGEKPSDAGEVKPLDRGKKFKELIEGEYRDLYNAQVQNILKQRLKGSEETVRKYKVLAPALELLEKKYGVESGDAEALCAAVTGDQTGERERAERRNARKNAFRIYREWMEDARSTGGAYPEFDLMEELRNPHFQCLLRGGAGIREAYELIHRDSIMEKAAKELEEKITNRILSGSQRPREGGLSSRSAAVIKADVSQMSRKARQDIIRRVQRGERISF